MFCLDGVLPVEERASITQKRGSKANSFILRPVFSWLMKNFGYKKVPLKLQSRRDIHGAITFFLAPRFGPISLFVFKAPFLFRFFANELPFSIAFRAKCAVWPRNGRFIQPFLGRFSVFLCVSLRRYWPSADSISSFINNAWSIVAKHH
jgi:hypothetical protein